jgi:hypothetical protein
VFAEFGRDGLGRGGVEIDDRHASAGLGHRDRDGPPDSLSGPVTIATPLVSLQL